MAGSTKTEELIETGEWKNALISLFQTVRNIWHFPLMRAEQLDALAKHFRKGKKRILSFSRVQARAFLQYASPWAAKVREHSKDLFHYLKSNLRNIWKRDFTVRRIALFFLFALVLGVAIKSLLSDRLTIGYQDYLLPPAETLVDLNAVQRDVLGQGGSTSLSRAVPVGEKCTE